MFIQRVSISNIYSVSGVIEGSRNLAVSKSGTIKTFSLPPESLQSLSLLEEKISQVSTQMCHWPVVKCYKAGTEDVSSFTGTPNRTQGSGKWPKAEGSVHINQT